MGSDQEKVISLECWRKLQRARDQVGSECPPERAYGLLKLDPGNQWARTLIRDLNVFFSNSSMTNQTIGFCVRELFGALELEADGDTAREIAELIERAMRTHLAALEAPAPDDMAREELDRIRVRLDELKKIC